MASRRRLSSLRMPEARALPSQEKEREVYETPLVEDVVLRDQEEDFVRSAQPGMEVDTEPIDAAAALKMFSGKVFDLRNPQTSRLEALEYTHVKPLEKPPRQESVRQMFVRLNSELNALARIAKEEGKGGMAFPSELEGGLGQLKEQLDRLGSPDQFGSVVDPAKYPPRMGGPDLATSLAKAASRSHVVSEPLSPHQAVRCDVVVSRTHTDVARRVSPLHSAAARVDFQLTALERLVGPVMAGGVRANAERLGQQLALMDLAHLEMLGVRVKLLSGVVDKDKDKAAAKRTAKSVQNERRVDAIYDSVGRVAEVVDEIPVVSSRLQSMQQVHSDAAAFVAHLDQLRSQQTALANALVGQHTALKELEGNMAANFQALTTAFASIHTRLQALEAKVA